MIIYVNMASISSSREDVRSSSVNFDSFVEDMQMMVTYVAADETGAMNPGAMPSKKSLPTSQMDDVAKLFMPSSVATVSSAPPVQAFNLGAAAIVSSRRAQNSASFVVDMDEIQSALNASLLDPIILSPPSTDTQPVSSGPDPQTSSSTANSPKIATRTVRAAGHSDAPRPHGLPAPRSGNTTPSRSSLSSSTPNPHLSAPIGTLSPLIETSTTSTGEDRSGSPSKHEDASGDGQVRQRICLQAPVPIPATRASQGYVSFEEMVLEPQSRLLKALCTCLQVTEATKTCASLVMIFEAKKRVLSMIQSMIEHEVGAQKTAATLFRNNSLTTHLMTCYTKLVGLPFLKTVIGPVIMDAFTEIDAGGVTFEIDPTKMAPGEDLKTNIRDLKRLVHAFFDRILNSRAVMPRNFMEICNTLQTSTVERFPESRFFVIGGFLFLRYICPAVVAPDGYKLINGTISDKQRRMLVLVSKILQTIANERTFGEKEEYMMCMNPLVNEYQGMVQYFFNQLAKPVLPNTPENVPNIVITAEDYQLALVQVLTQVKAAKTKLAAHPSIADDPKLLYSIENIDNLAIM